MPEQPAAVRISKVDARLERTAYGATGLFLSLPFIATGAFFAIAGFLQLDIIKKGANAPLWVIGMVGLVFFMSGAILFVYSLAGLIQKRRNAAQRQRHPGEPWHYDYPWQPQGVSDDAARRAVSGVTLVAIFGFFTVPFIWWAFLSGQGPLMVKIIVGGLLLIWILAVGNVIYRIAQFGKFGTGWLEFESFPFFVGQRISVGFYNRQFDIVNIECRFVEERFETAGSGNNRRTTKNSYRHYQHRQRKRFTPGQFARIDLTIPDNPQWSNQLIADPAVRYWELVIEAELPGIDFRTTFPLPVYHAPGAHGTPNGNFGRVDRKVRAGRALIPFEAKFIGIPAAVIALILFLAPEVATAVSRGVAHFGYRVVNQSSLAPLPDVNIDALDVAFDGRDVWALSKYDVTRFSHGEPADPARMFDRRIARQFGYNPGALSSLLIAPDGDIWLGGWHGEVYRGRAGTWEKLARREDGIGKVTRMLSFDAGTFVFGNGMWQWSESLRALVKLFPDARRIDCAAVIEGTLYFGSDNRLGRWNGRTGEWLARLPAAIHAIHRDPSSGNLLLGTTTGLKWLDPRFQTIRSELDDARIQAIATDDDGRLWIATLKQGLMFRTDRAWARFDTSWGLPGNHVADVLVDANDRLWVAIYGKGISTVQTAALAPQANFM